jgi:hypothetical protein
VAARRPMAGGSRTGRADAPAGSFRRQFLQEFL